MRKKKEQNMEHSQVIERIKATATKILPKGSTLYLYGSRARGDAHAGSDWDLLLLLDKPQLADEDFANYSYPFLESGWDMGEDFSVHAYTKDRWFNGPHALFYFNVEEDFEPTVHTYARINIEGNTALVRGYALRGTDNVTVQGFMYWRQVNEAKERGDGQHRAPAIPKDAMTVEASGRVMEAQLTGLDTSAT